MKVKERKSPPSDDLIALRLQNAGKEAHLKLAQFLGVSSITPSCYAYKLRVKEEGKLLEKKARKLKDKPDYTLFEITDVIGLRLVTLFRSEMPDILQKVVNAIKHIDSPTPNPFRKNSLEEIIIYSTNPKYDEIIPIIKDNSVTCGISPIIKQSGAGYSSIHLVSRIDYNVAQLGNYYVPVEIQIRTVFEDAWGEIDHKYGYVFRSGKEIGTPVGNPEFVLLHLKVLKKFSDACAEYADIIREEANPSTFKRRSHEKVISVVPDEYIIKRFRELKIDTKLIDKYIDARSEKVRATSLLSSDREGAIKDLLQAAELFREILGEKAENLCDEKEEYGNYLFRYYVKMNEAICLLTTNLADNVRKAYNIYFLLEEPYGRFPLLSMRLGQSLGKLGRIDQAIIKFKEAKNLAESLFEKYKNCGSWTDELPETDYKHMRSSIHRAIGYQYWMKVTDVDDTGDKLAFLKKAYDVTEELASLEDIDKEDVRKMHNNLLYYAVEYLQIANREEKDKTFEDQIVSKIPEHLKALEDSIDLATCSDIEYLDTLSKAYYFVGRKDDTGRVCDRILLLSLNAANKAFDDDLKFELAQNAFGLKSFLRKK